MQEMWVWSLVWVDLLEKWMATHSSILAWRIPWTEKPRRLQSMWLQRVDRTEGLTLNDWLIGILSLFLFFFCTVRAPLACLSFPSNSLCSCRDSGVISVGRAMCIGYRVSVLRCVQNEVTDWHWEASAVPGRGSSSPPALLPCSLVYVLD